MIDHLKKNKKFFKISAIAKEAGVYPSSLQKAIEGKRKLRNSQELKVGKVLKEINYDKN